jgi:hypothetical protein
VHERVVVPHAAIAVADLITRLRRVQHRSVARSPNAPSQSTYMLASALCLLLVCLLKQGSQCSWHWCL